MPAPSSPTADSEALAALQRKLAAFADARDWEQFHSPKNLAMALIAECAELVEHFQWLSGDESASLPEDKRAQVRLELADVLIYLVRLADKLDVDLVAAAHEKIAINEARYPAEQVRGDARRASEYET
jgi:NTP pyrophosphatase (non-canonical NTP hydrolase)